MAGDGSVTSSAALAVLTVPTPLLTADFVLHLLVVLASPLQLTTSLKKKGNEISLQINDGSNVLTERNTILRCLCGMAFHNALDGSPFYLLGGHSAAALGGGSPAAALGLAGISSWMSMSSSIRQQKGSEDVDKLCCHLNTYLQSRSSLVPSPGVTVADLDLATAILSRSGGVEGGLAELLDGRPNVRRWMIQCQQTMTELAELGNASHQGGKSKVPPISVKALEDVEPGPTPVPVFFYGDEDEGTVAAFAAPKAPSETAQKKSGKKGSPPEKAAKGKGGGGDGKALTDEQKKAAADKRAKKAADKAKKKKDKQPAPASAPSSELDISALDIRVGHILKAWNHETADKLYCEEVDVGSESGGVRKIASGLRPFYKLEEMQNRRVLVLCNLKARNLVGFPSHGMVLCASNSDHTKVEFVVPPEGAKVGERVAFEGFEGEAEAENKVGKKKIFEKLAPDLKTDGEGFVVWKGAKATTSSGQVKAANGMADAQVS